MNKYRNHVLIFTLSVLMLSFQNCQTGLKTGSISDLTSSLSSKLGGGGISGNGEGYEGKLTAQFVREIPGSQCSGSFETLTQNPNGLSIETVDPRTCQKETRLVSDEIVMGSVGGILKSVGDGLFVNSDFLTTYYPEYQSQVWCQSKGDENKVFDVLILQKKHSTDLIGTMYIHDKGKSQVRSVSDFALDFERKDRLQIYSHPGLKLEILTDRPSSSKAGSYFSSVHLMMDEQEYEMGLECRLGNIYDGAIWPSSPLLSGNFKNFQFSNYFGKFFFLKDIYPSSSELGVYDPKLDKHEILSIPLPSGETISGFSMLNNSPRVSLRTFNSPNRYVLHDILDRKNIFESPQNIQVLNYGNSLLGPWFQARTIQSILNDGSFVYQGSYDLYLPSMKNYKDFQIPLPPRDKLLEFVVQGASMEDQKILFEVYFGEGAYYQGETLRIKSQNIYNDLAVLDMSSGSVKMLNIGPGTGKGFHYQPNHLPHIYMTNNKVFTIVSDAKIERLIQVNLSDFSIQVIAETSRDLRGGMFSRFYFAADKVVYMDSENILQGIDLTTGDHVKYGPSVQIRGLFVDPTLHNNKLIYFRPLGGSNFAPVVWDLSGKLNIQPVYESLPALHFDETLGSFSSQEVYKSASNVLLFRGMFLSPKGALFIEADTDFDGKMEFYTVDLSKPQSGFKQISNRYLQYGGVAYIFMDLQENIYFFMGKGTQQFLLRWQGE